MSCIYCCVVVRAWFGTETLNNIVPRVFFPNKLSLFVNSWFYIVVHMNHAVKLFMANAINKDIPHHRSHTEFNKHKHQAFLPPHFTYIHKLNLNLTWNSNLLFVACFYHLTGKAVVLIKKEKKVVVTVEQGTQLYFKDLKPYFVLNTHQSRHRSQTPALR